uniref:C2H2-type domain-containing protein n=1 Tax=Anopheles epiroticus TaxID=199890 RepID=A0A182PW98_9DIPT
MVPLKEAKQEKLDIEEMELMTAGLEDDDEGGCYFVDQKGNYYFQASEDAELTAVETEPADFEQLAEGQDRQTEEEVSYVLIMNDDADKTTLVEDGGLGGNKDNKIYEFDDADYVVSDQQEPQDKKPAALGKRTQPSTGSTCSRSFRHKGNLIRHMALHDPESTMSKELEALREGRQKKVQISFDDGVFRDEEEYEGEEDDVEEEDEDDVDEEEEEEEEEEDGDEADEQEEPTEALGTSDVVTVQDEDGQYVVLEVIQLQDKDNSVNVTKKPQKKRAATKRKAAPLSTGLQPTTSKPRTATTTTMASATATAATRNVKKEPLSIEAQDHTLDVDGMSLVMVTGEADDEGQEIVIEQQNADSGDEFILSTEDLQDTEMLMSSLENKRSRYDVTISQAELEKNMSNCFGFD